ncbi:ATP-grasp domain-containing protein [Streptomyces bambusae]|uniref:ATP-grasp domain-containing protein n=1 Tax=Streptomyces bambusae TaxID=1550616 RepID=UPI001CFE03D5|nr:ATP-grasp domain-containing protein [Streptomyces bambusae]MCB5165692.1 ATP-grasp domain-containing protein [Streptomyces bambusae]
MTNAPAVLLIGGTDSHLEYVKKQGVRVVLLQHPDKINAYQTRTADVLLMVDYTDWDTVLPYAETARAVHGCTKVLSLTEGGLSNAARLNDHFGWSDGHRYEVSRRMRDKLLMRTHLEANGGAGVAFAPVTDFASLAAFGERAGYPFIVKPTDTTAGFGLLKAAGPEDLPRVWQRIEGLLGQRTDRGSTLFKVTGFLAEAHIPGPEFSVETFSFGGRHVVLAVTEKLTDDEHFAELGHALPARLDPDRRAALTGAVTSFLTVMGVTDGPGHTEIRLGTDRPVVVESHNRLGGGHIAELVEAAYGINMYAYAAGWPLGTVPELLSEPVPAAAACTRFVLRDPGTVTSVSGVEDVAARSDVLAVSVSVKPGDTVRPLRDNWDRIGFVAATAPDTDAAVALCEDLAGRAIRVDVAPQRGEG